MECMEHTHLEQVVRELSCELTLTLALERRCALADDLAGVKALEPVLAEVMEEYKAAVVELKRHVEMHHCSEAGAARRMATT